MFLPATIFFLEGPLDAYAVELARGCHDQIDRIDYALQSVSHNWSLYRMPGTDRNLLRLAVYEMRFLDGDEAIDDAVVINEAVESEGLRHGRVVSLRERRSGAHRSHGPAPRAASGRDR